MICPCKNCLVFVRCKQKVKKDYLYHYTFAILLKECEDLRKFFGLNTLIHRVRLNQLSQNGYAFGTNLNIFIEKMPNGRQLIDSFLAVMEYEQPREKPIKIKPRKKRK